MSDRAGKARLRRKPAHQRLSTIEVRTPFVFQKPSTGLVEGSMLRVNGGSFS